MGWQDGIAIAVVFGAVFYLSSLVWKGLIGGKTGAGGCGSSCGKCSSGSGGALKSGSDDPGSLVSIGLPSARAASAQSERSSRP